MTDTLVGVSPLRKAGKKTLTPEEVERAAVRELVKACLLYTSDAADERSSVDLGGRRIIKKKNTSGDTGRWSYRRKRTTCK